MKVIVTRHGQTEWNVLEKVQGQTDTELNDIGRKQAEETGRLIKDEKIDIIISSPLKRARETAEIINKNFNIPIIEDKRLMERNLGKNEGITKAEIMKMKKSNPNIDDFWNYVKNVEFDDVETMHEFCDRVYEFLDEISEKYKDKTVLLVTHGGTSVPIQCYFENYPLEKLIDKGEVIGLKNCEIVKFEKN